MSANLSRWSKDRDISSSEGSSGAMLYVEEWTSEVFKRKLAERLGVSDWSVIQDTAVFADTFKKLAFAGEVGRAARLAAVSMNNGVTPVLVANQFVEEDFSLGYLSDRIPDQKEFAYILDSIGAHFIRSNSTNELANFVRDFTDGTLKARGGRERCAIVAGFLQEVSAALADEQEAHRKVLMQADVGDVARSLAKQLYKQASLMRFAVDESAGAQDLRDMAELVGVDVRAVFQQAAASYQPPADDYLPTVTDEHTGLDESDLDNMLVV